MGISIVRMAIMETDAFRITPLRKPTIWDRSGAEEDTHTHLTGGVFLTL